MRPGTALPIVTIRVDRKELVELDNAHPQPRMGRDGQYRHLSQRWDEADRPDAHRHRVRPDPCGVPGRPCFHPAGRIGSPFTEVNAGHRHRGQGLPMRCRAAPSWPVRGSRRAAAVAVRCLCPKRAVWSRHRTYISPAARPEARGGRKNRCIRLPPPEGPGA